MTAPVLSYPKYDEGTFILDTDASLFGIGCVLSQMQQNEERVIAYGSKTLSKSQRRYCTTYRELLAVVTFVKEFRHYLWGRHFIIRTDHSSLVWIKNFKEPEGTLARWLTVLDTYDYEIQFRQGAHHGNADAMSRLRPKVCKRDDCPDCVEIKIIQGKQSASVKQQPLSPSSGVTKQSLIVAPVQQNRNNQGTESAGGTLKNNQSAVGTDSHILNKVLRSLLVILVKLMSPMSYRILKYCPTG